MRNRVKQLIGLNAKLAVFSGEPFCSEAKLSVEKVLARLAGLAGQSRLHGKF